MKLKVYSESRVAPENFDALAKYLRSIKIRLSLLNTVN